MPRLTKRTVDSVKPESGDFFVWDTETRGFGLRVWPSGRKTFVFKYQLGGRAGTTKRYTIGDYGTFTPDDARREATRLRGIVARGESPTEQRAAKNAAVRAKRMAPTIADLAHDFLTDRRAKKKRRTVEEYERLLNKDVLPVLGKAHVVDLTRAQVARLHLSMSDRPYLANRMLTILSAMLRFAELHGQRPPGTNPCAGIDPYPEHSRERYLTKEELKRLGNALTRAERVGLPPAPRPTQKPKNQKNAKHRPKSAGTPTPANLYAVAALRFLVLTGWRESEALGLRWNQVDFARSLATLPDTKTGRSNRHLGAPALALLSELPRTEDSPFVFPGAKPGTHLVEIKRVWEAVRHAAGLHGVRLHDLRHSFASVGASGGLSLPMIGALLGHREVSTTQRYSHLADDPRKAAADRVAAEVAAMLAGDEAGRPALSLEQAG
jgi:integrase